MRATVFAGSCEDGMDSARALEEDVRIGTMASQVSINMHGMLDLERLRYHLPAPPTLAVLLSSPDGCEFLR